MSSLRARMIRGITSRYIKRMNLATVDVQEVRQRLEKLSRLLKRAFGVSVEATTVNGLKAEWLRPKGVPQGKVLLYLHGGAYVLPNTSANGQPYRACSRNPCAGPGVRACTRKPVSGRHR